MARRTNPLERGPIDVPREVRDQLNAYKDELLRVSRLRPTSGELLSALLSGGPVWQAAAMLNAYRPKVDLGENPGDYPGSAGEEGAP